MTKIYRSKKHKHIVCYAVQWFDTDECFREVREFIDGVNGADLWSVDYRKKPAKFSVTTNGYEYVAEEGDYIVQTAGQDYYVIKKEIFEKQWELINETN